METQLARAAALHTEPSGPACWNNNGWISRFPGAVTPPLCLNSARKSDAVFGFRLNYKNHGGWRSQKFREIRQAFLQLWQSCLKRRLRVVFGAHGLLQSSVFLERTTRPTAFKHTPVDAAFSMPQPKRDFTLVFLLSLSYQDTLVLGFCSVIFFPPFRASRMCLSMRIRRLLSSSASLENFLVTFYSDLSHHSTQGFSPPAWVIPCLAVCYFYALVEPRLSHPLTELSLFAKILIIVFIIAIIFHFAVPLLCPVKQGIVPTWWDRQRGDINTANACPHHFRSITDHCRRDCSAVKNDIVACRNSVLNLMAVV